MRKFWRIYLRENKKKTSINKRLSPSKNYFPPSSYTWKHYDWIVHKWPRVYLRSFYSNDLWPRLLANRGYDGAAADVWSCGVILFELLSGYLPFDDRNLMMLYRKISRAEYTYPPWFTESQKKLISRILDPNPKSRIKIPEIIDEAWFQTDYVPSCGCECDKKIYFDDVNAAFDATEDDTAAEKKVPKYSSFINAFQLIAMSDDLDLSGLFEQEDKKQKTRLGSRLTVNETIKKIEAAAMDLSLSVERMNNFKMKMQPKAKVTRCTRSYYDLSAEVIEVAPTNCVIEISKSAGEVRLYSEFCKSLSSLLTEKSNAPLQIQDSIAERITSNNIQQTGSTEKQNDFRGYSSS